MTYARADRPPTFSWRRATTYLLSDRILDVLLGLGAFLILSSGAVISAFNPTGLAPVPHLGAVLATTIAFYGAGLGVRRILGPGRTGAVLLAIGGGFVPLAVWTLGRDGLLGWSPGALWLAASLLCLPIYLASYAVLRDRTFGMLTALAGLSELLATLDWLDVPLEWGLCGLVALSLGYLLLAARLARGWESLVWAVFLTARLTTPLAIWTLMAMRYVPISWDITSRSPGALFPFSVVAAWWLGIIFYALCGHLLGLRGYRFIAAWSLPIAFLLTLAETPWDSAWYGLGLAMLGPSYLVYGRWFRRLLVGEVRPSLEQILREPAYQVGLALTLGAAAWPRQTSESAIPTLLLLSVTYVGAAVAWKQPAWLYPAVGSALIAYLSAVTLIQPELALADRAASLVGPVWLLYGLAYAVVRPRPAGDAPAWPRVRTSRGWADPWAAPLLACGLAALIISTLGATRDAEASLRTAAAYAVLLAMFATLWREKLEVWTSLTLAGMAFQAGLILGQTPWVDQPPHWGLAALTAGLLAIVVQSRRVATLGVWSRPLFLSSVGVGAMALLGALTAHLIFGTRATLQPLAATAALTGLTLVAHGFHQRRRLLGYLGVALLEKGYMVQLHHFDVGQPQAFAVPAGLYLLAIAYLEWRRGTAGGLKRTLEGSGLTLMLGASLLQAVGLFGDGIDRHAYAAFFLFEGVAIFGLGAVLRWRKTFQAGALAVVADVLILLADPLRAMNVWYLVAVVGLAMIGLVVLIEQRRFQLATWLDDRRQRLETWD